MYQERQTQDFQLVWSHEVCKMSIYFENFPTISTAHTTDRQTDRQTLTEDVVGWIGANLSITCPEKGCR